MAKVDIWMPLYIGDYLGDTMRLTTEQHGAYILMLMECWMSGPLPDDDEELAAISRLPVDRWLKARAKLSRFFVIEDGLWRQMRVESELEKALKRREIATENGKKGGRPRKDGKPTENLQVNPQVSGGLTQKEPGAKAKRNPQKSSSPSPSPSQDKNPLPSQKLSKGDEEKKITAPEQIWGAAS